MAMDIHVYDTYVKAKNGDTMHFDVITAEKDPKKAIEYAKQWLESIGEGDSTVTGEECNLCRTQGGPPQVENEIKENGFCIQKMEECP